MAVSDLTGTTWVINEEPNVLKDKSFSIQFTTNNLNCTYIIIDISGIQYTFYEDSNYDNRTVLEYNHKTETFTWLDQAYRTITITGGTDVTNSNLITWLESYAVQQVPTVNTTSSFSDISLTSHEGYITLTIDNVDFDINATEVVNNNEEVNLISFTIDGTTYQAEDGMTWEEWVDSAYNTGGYAIVMDTSISSRSNRYSLVDSSYTTVNKSDLIIANEQYTEVSAGSGR